VQHTDSIEAGYWWAEQVRLVLGWISEVGRGKKKRWRDKARAGYTFYKTRMVGLV